MKILVVDDNVRVRKMISSVVFDVTDHILECGDAAEAEAAYETHRPDWVLMDLMMPGVDGIAATRSIRQAHPDAKIVIVTSYESQAMRDDAHRAGAFAYVLKENLSDLRQLMIDGRC